MNREPLRIGLVAGDRDAFKGDAGGVARRAADALETRRSELGYVVERAPHTVVDADAADGAARWARAASLDLLVVLHATFATGDLLAPLLDAVDRVAVWAVPERDGLPLRRPGVDAGMRPLPLNSLCGLNMTLSLLDAPPLTRTGPVKWLWGSTDDAGDAASRFGRRWSTTLQALHGLRALARARVLQIGGTAPAFYRLEERPNALDAHVDVMPLDALYERMGAVDPGAVSAHAAAWRAREPVVGASDQHVEVAARTELALAAIADEGAYDALALRCWPEFADRCGGMACAAVGAMADRRIPTACEGDVMGALSMLALQGVADAPSALLDLSDLDPDGDRLLLWHCGNAPAALAATPGTRLTTHFNRDGTGIVRDMHLAAGPASGFRLLDGGASAVILAGRLADPSDPDVDGVRGWWHDLRWDGVPTSAYDVVARVLDERLPHHLALAPGDRTEALHELCSWLGASVLPAAPTRDALIAPRDATP